MEDAYTAIPFLLEVPVPADCLSQVDILPPRIATQVKSASNSPTSSDGDGSGDEADPAKANGQAGRSHGSARLQSGLGVSTSGAGDYPGGGPPPPYMETLHFFGVFDGHGGAEAALHCAQTLHQRIAEALSAATTGPSDAAAAAPPPDAVMHPHVHPAAAECSTCPAVGAAVGTEEASLVALQPSGSLTAVSAVALASVSEARDAFVCQFLHSDLRVIRKMLCFIYLALVTCLKCALLREPSVPRQNVGCLASFQRVWLLKD